MGRMYWFARDDRRREKHVGRGKSSSQDKGEGALAKDKLGKAKDLLK
jgi:hypothetical protein